MARMHMGVTVKHLYRHLYRPYCKEYIELPYLRSIDIGVKACQIISGAPLHVGAPGIRLHVSWQLIQSIYYRKHVKDSLRTLYILSAIDSNISCMKSCLLTIF